MPSKTNKKEERTIRTGSRYDKKHSNEEENNQKYDDDFNKEYDYTYDYGYSYDLDEVDTQEEKNMVIVDMDIREEEETKSVGLPEEMGIMEGTETIELENELPNYVENLHETLSMNDVVIEEIHDEGEWSDDRGETTGGNHLHQQNQQHPPFFRIQAAQRMYTH